jgi:predicted tellurium resistance membrane protein TerC
VILADLSGPVPWLILAAATGVFLFVDLRFYRPGERPDVREAALWTIGWTALAFAAALPLWLFSSGHDAIAYITVYVVTRALSFDNLLVFIILFAYFAIPHQQRNKLLALGIVGMLILRGAAILGGLTLIHHLHPIVYVLGALLIVLAVRVWRGVEHVDPERNLGVRLARRLGASPLTLALAAVITADIAFAIDSIPAGFAITGNSFLIWMGNVFSLLGLAALFVLVRALLGRLRYLDETIALVLVFIGLKLILERWWKPGTGITLGIVAALFTLGVTASLAAGDRFTRDGPGSPRRAGPPPDHR